MVLATLDMVSLFHAHVDVVTIGLEQGMLLGFGQVVVKHINAHHLGDGLRGFGNAQI